MSALLGAIGPAGVLLASLGVLFAVRVRVARQRHARVKARVLRATRLGGTWSA